MTVETVLWGRQISCEQIVRGIQKWEELREEKGCNVRKRDRNQGEINEKKYYYYYYYYYYLLTAIGFSLGGSSPCTCTDKTNKNKYAYTKQYKNTLQTIQNTVNTSTHITKTPTHYKISLNNHSTRYTPNEMVTIRSSTLSIRLEVWGEEPSV